MEESIELWRPNIESEMGLSVEERERMANMRTLEGHRITTTKEIPKREFLFKMFGRPCFPRGELVAITGRAKSGKTFVSSMLMTLCVKQEVLMLRRMESRKLRVLWYDTEQSEESTQEILRDRIGRMSGPDFDESMFDVFNVRSQHFSSRRVLMEAAVRTLRPDLMILDGVRDLVDDINNGVLSQEVVESLMKLASDTNCCIVSVLHQNKASEDRNLRGWIGTELTYKCFEAYECEKDEAGNFSLKQIMTRKYDISNVMRYTVNYEGIPVSSNLVAEESLNNSEYVVNNRLEIEKLVVAVFPKVSEKVRGFEVKRRFKGLTKIDNERWYMYFVVEAMRRGLIEKESVSEQEVYYKRLKLSK